MDFIRSGKKVGMLQCEPNENGVLVCQFQEIGKGGDVAVFEIVAAVDKDGDVQMTRFKSINKKPIDRESLEEAQKIMYEQLMGRAPTETI